MVAALGAGDESIARKLSQEATKVGKRDALRQALADRGVAQDVIDKIIPTKTPFLHRRKVQGIFIVGMIVTAAYLLWGRQEARYFRERAERARAVPEGYEYEYEVPQRFITTARVR
jgi:hypothetical protein